MADSNQEGGNVNVDDAQEIANWMTMGNHWVATTVWVVVGISCVGATPTFLAADETKKTALYPVMTAVGMLLTMLLYFFGYMSRDNRLVRNPRRWVGSVVGNGIATGITILTFAEYKHTTQNDIIGQMLIAVAIFAFMEVTKPIFDFGLLQFFLRQPLLTAMAYYFRKSEYGLGWWYLYTCALWLFGTTWQAYFMQLFRVGLGEIPLHEPQEPPSSAVNQQPDLTHESSTQPDSTQPPSQSPSLSSFDSHDQYYDADVDLFDQYYDPPDVDLLDV